jgi:hypothetical protein
MSDYNYLQWLHIVRKFTAIYNSHIRQNDKIISRTFVEYIKYNYTRSNSTTVGTYNYLCVFVLKEKHG